MEDNHHGIYEIDKIHFGILSSKEIKDMAVVNVTNNKICAEDGTGTIYDPRMGPTLDHRRRHRGGDRRPYPRRIATCAAAQQVCRIA